MKLKSILVLQVFINYLTCNKVNIRLTSHVGVQYIQNNQQLVTGSDPQNLLDNQNSQTYSIDNFNNILSSNHKEIPVDIFIQYKDKENQNIFLYTKTHKFNSKQILNILYCPENIDLDQLSTLQQIKDNCIEDTYTDIFFDLQQESNFLQFDSNIKKRCSFGGLKYVENLVGSQLVNDRNQIPNLKGFFTKYFGKEYLRENFDQNSKNFILTKVHINLLNQFQYLNDLAEASNLNNYCSSSFLTQDNLDILKIRFLKIQKQNILLIKTSLQDFENSQLHLDNTRNIPSLIQQQIESMGLNILPDIFEYQVGQPKNFSLKFDFYQQNLKVDIIEHNEDESYLQNDQTPSLNDKFFKLKKIDKTTQVKLLACNGFSEIKKKINPIASLNLMGCTEISYSNQIIINPNNIEQFKQDVSQDIQIDNFQIQFANLKNSQPLQQISIQGFHQVCDTMLDNLLGVLFILCYLKYQIQGNLFEFINTANKNNDGKNHKTSTIREAKIDRINFSLLEFQSQRILTKKGQRNQQIDEKSQRQKDLEAEHKCVNCICWVLCFPLVIAVGAIVGTCYGAYYCYNSIQYEGEELKQKMQFKRRILLQRFSDPNNIENLIVGNIIELDKRFKELKIGEPFNQDEFQSILQKTVDIDELREDLQNKILSKISVVETQITQDKQDQIEDIVKEAIQKNKLIQSQNIDTEDDSERILIQILLLNIYLDKLQVQKNYQKLNINYQQ